MDNTQNIISFCTGYGGLELGLKRVIPNMRTVAYVEIEAYAIANLVAKIEEGKMDAAPIWTDIKTFNGRPFRDKVHGIIGGYPCQPFSQAGKRQGSKDPRHLWPFIRKHISTIRPLFCIFENVEGHVSLGFDAVYKDLRALGYKVEAGLFTAAEVGASHVRTRLYILAYSDSLRELQQAWVNENIGGWFNNTFEKRVPTNSIFERYERLQRLQLNTEENITGKAGATRPTKQSFNDAFGWRTWTTKPFIRGKDDGCSDRTHRIRLLGNGVVPDQAEKAIRYLFSQT